MRALTLFHFAATLLALLGPARADEPSWSKGPPTDPAFFPLAVWVQSPSNAPRYHDIGINLYVALWNGPTEEKLDALDAAGIKAICNQDLRFKDRDTIIGWMHGDEPDNAQSLGPDQGYGPPIPTSDIVESYQRHREADPDRPILLNLGQGVAWDGWHGRGVRTNHPEDYPEYVKGCDIASFDIYPASHDREAVAGKLWYVPHGVDRLRTWTEDKKPVWCCIETTRISNLERKPTPAEVRSEVWMALIHGAKGIIYFCHQFEPQFIEAGFLADEEMTREVANINCRIKELAPMLNSPDIPGAATVTSSSDETPIDFAVKQSPTATYLLTASMRPGNATGSFTLTNGQDARVEVLDEDRTIEAPGGTWTDPFSDYQVHLYKITAAD